MDKKINLFRPHLCGSELKYIHDAFEQNWVAPLGPNVNGFETDLKSYLDRDIEVVALSSGTAALHLGLVNLGVQAGDEVICQSNTFVATANAIAYLGAVPIFVDSEQETWNMCPNALEDAIRSRMIATTKAPKAIIPVHLYGMPAKMDEIMAVAAKYNIPVLEDAAEALGSTYKGQACGTFGTMAALSFNGNKIITTSGGGALVCSSKEQKDQTAFLSTQARDEAPHYEHSQIGYNYRMSNICAGIGRGQMEVLNDRVAARRVNNKFYQDLFQNIDGVTVFVEPSSSFFSNHWLSCITIDEKVAGKSSEALRLALLDENIESRPLWKPMHLQPVFSESPYYGTTVAEDLFNCGLCLPSGSNLSDADRSRIKEAVERFFN